MRAIVISLIVILIVVVAAPVAFLFAALEPAPLVPQRPPATTEDAVRAKIFAKRLRETIDPEFGAQQFTASEQEINSFITIASRGLPSLRGDVQVRPNEIAFTMSARPPRGPVQKWLNVYFTVVPERDRLHISTIRIGRYDLPPPIVLPIAAAFMDVFLGHKAGTIALHSVDRVVVKGSTVNVRIALASGERESLLNAGRKRLRQTKMLGDVEDVRAYVLAMDEAGAKGRLPTKGSFLPYLKFVLDLSQVRGQTGDPATEIRSAIMSVAIYCGEPRLESLIGKVLTEEFHNRPFYCWTTTMGGRDDLRKHFIVSAALKVASDSGVAFAVGEFKELLDSYSGKGYRSSGFSFDAIAAGSGFSFDDIAADLSGIRFAETMLDNSDPKDVPEALIGKLTSESVIFPSVAGLPSGMREEVFKARYGDVESAAYKDVIAEIKRRIDGLPLYRSN